MTSLPSKGSAGEDLRCKAHKWWGEAATRSGRKLADFNPGAPLEQRLAWALQAGLLSATLYARYSSKRQHSIDDQVRAVVTFAAQSGIYVAPEMICLDEAVKGRRIRRDGLDRLKLILKSRQATVLLVFKVSRLFRQAFLGYQLIQQEVVEEGLRAISVSQGIDTDDKRTWKAQLQLHGLLDDLLLDAIADHCREGLIGLFKQNYLTGAVTIGYRAVVVAGAPPTNRGKPRTMPAVDPAVAEMIRQHFAWIRDGMPIREGLRRWRKAGGPCDARSTIGAMTYSAYRRMLSNVRLTGRWEFGRKRNAWSSKRDYTRQIVQPDSDVHVVQCEDLRIVPEDLFLAVQKRLGNLEVGPRSPRKQKDVHLHDLVTQVFHCPHCKQRYHQCGARGQAMRCSGPDCPRPAMVNREQAVLAVCDKLTELIGHDSVLVEQVISASQQLDARGEDEIAQEIVEIERKVRVLANRIADLTELAGEGSDADRDELKAKIRSAQAERTGLQIELARLRQAVSQKRTITPEEVKQILAELGSVLQNAAAGSLGADAIYKAADVFRRLVGGRVWVHVELRPGRKRAVVRGVFNPSLVHVVLEEVQIPGGRGDGNAAAIEVWLRRPPRLDQLAAEVQRLYDVEGLGYRQIGKRLGIGSGNACQCYRRYYQMRALSEPPRRTNLGRPRKAG